MVMAMKMEKRYEVSQLSVEGRCVYTVNFN